MHNRSTCTCHFRNDFIKDTDGSNRTRNCGCASADEHRREVWFNANDEKDEDSKLSFMEQSDSWTCEERTLTDENPDPEEITAGFELSEALRTLKEELTTDEVPAGYEAFYQRYRNSMSTGCGGCNSHMIIDMTNNSAADLDYENHGIEMYGDEMSSTKTFSSDYNDELVMNSSCPEDDNFQHVPIDRLSSCSSPKKVSRSADTEEIKRSETPENNEDNDGYINFSALKQYLDMFASKKIEEDVSDDGDAKEIDPLYIREQLLRKTKFTFYSERTGLVRSSCLREIGNGTLPDLMRAGVFWLDICNPSKPELKVLSDVFNMHPLTLEDLQEDDIREKCDVFPNYYFICIKAFDSDVHSVDYMSPINLYIIACPNCVISIHYTPLQFSRTISKRIRLLSARNGISSDWIMYSIVDDVIDSFSPSIDENQLECDAIEDLVNDLPDGYDHAQLLWRITAARKKTTQLSRLLFAKSEVIRVTVKRCGSRLSEDAAIYLRDLQDHILMMDQALDHNDENLTRSHSNYLAQVNIEMTILSNRMNNIMKKLTSGAMVTMPCSIVTGIFGMNMFVPGYLSITTQSIIPFASLVVLMTACTVALYCVGRRYDWF